MNDTEAEIRQSQRDAAKADDLPKLKALANQFPKSLAAQEFNFRDGENLVDLAIHGGHHDVTNYLMLEHGFEVSSRFNHEKKKFKGDEYGATGCHEYFQTLEMLGNAALNHGSTSSLNEACYLLRNWANEVGNQLPAEDTSTHDIPQTASLNPEFIRLAASGALRREVARKMADTERSIPLAQTHAVRMLNALSENIDAIETYCQHYMAHQPSKRSTGFTIS